MGDRIGIRSWLLRHMGSVQPYGILGHERENVTASEFHGHVELQFRIAISEFVL